MQLVDVWGHAAMNLVRPIAFAALAALSMSSSAAEPLAVATFPAAGIEKVVLRASAAEQATVVPLEESAVSIIVSAVPSGGARGYRPPDPNWKEKTPTEWGLRFVAQQYGATLVISSLNEIHHIHHHYTLESIRIELPANVELVRERRVLSGDGRPDLARAW